MKAKILILLMSSILSLQGCAAFQSMKMTAVAYPEQQVGYQETITSQKKHFVSLAPYQEQNVAKGKTSFVLFVKNCGEDPINISSDNVSVIFEGNTKKWASRKIKVVSFDDLMNEVRSNRIAAISARYSLQRPRYRDVVVDVEDGQAVYYSTTERVPMYDTHAYGPPSKAAVEKLVLKPQAIMPGQSCSGLVVCDTRDMNYKVEGDFQVVVSVNGEDHKFTFNRSPYG